MIGGRFTTDIERLPFHLSGGYDTQRSCKNSEGHFAIEAAAKDFKERKHYPTLPLILQTPM